MVPYYRLASAAAARGRALVRKSQLRAPSLPPRPSRAFLKDSHSRAPQGVDPYLKLQVIA